MSEFTHFDEAGHAVMVDVSEKDDTCREAAAAGKIYACDEVLEAVQRGTSKKGDVLGVARVAGIMGAKQTSSLIPLCHTLLIQNVSVDFELLEQEHCIEARCKVKTTGKTGVEMEALTGVSVALLTVYDMCKALDKKMVLSDIHLLEKTGGKSGDFHF